MTMKRATKPKHANTPHPNFVPTQLRAGHDTEVQLRHAQIPSPRPTALPPQTLRLTQTTAFTITRLLTSRTEKQEEKL